MPTQKKIAKKKTDAYQTRVVGGAYLIKGLLRRLRVVEAINEALPHQPAKGATYGELMQVLIANRLSFTPEPLVHIGAWAAEHGLDQVFGLDAAGLDDDRLGAGLEGLAEHQVDIWVAVLKRAVAQCGLDLSELHDDTTSVYFEGAYEDATGQPLGGGERIPLMVEGYNKDGQRHKVQFVLSLVVAGRTPVWYRPWDGNQTDDAVYLADMTALRQTLLAPENAVLVGDRKLSNQATLVAFSRQNQRFLGAHPWTDTAKAVWRETQAQLAAGQLSWQPSDYVSQNETRKPAAERTRYQVCEVRYDIVDSETSVSYPVRWIFSHSSAKAALDLRQREKALAAGEEALRRIAGLVGKYDYTRQAVIEQRLEQALRKVQARAYFSYTLTGNDEAGDWRLRWRRLPKAIQTEAAFDGVALLCTNVPAADWSAATVMSKYKQQVLAEQAIDFIKSPVQIRPMWLHQPKRLAGLTLVVMLAVLLAALLELQVRRWLAKQGQSLTGLRPGKRRTTMPTAEALLKAFADYTLVIVRRARGGQEVHLPQLRPLQQQIWNALQLPTIAELAA